MSHKKSLEALNRKLMDINNNSKVMGGKLLALTGDFRRTLPIIPRSTPVDEMAIEEIEDAFYMELLKEAEREFFRDKVVADNVVKLSCGEHTFQLAFDDALEKNTEATELIQKGERRGKEIANTDYIECTQGKKKLIHYTPTTHD